jgi:hypothetical protein
VFIFVPNFRSEAFRTDQGPEQVDDQRQRDDCDKNVFHGSQLPARVRVRDAQTEERDGHDDKDGVGHGLIS